jgi:hypothetical protein
MDNMKYVQTKEKIFVSIMVLYLQTTITSENDAPDKNGVYKLATILQSYTPNY